MKRWQVAVFVGAGFVAGVVVGALFMRPRSRGLEQFEEFCLKTQLAVTKDRMDFESLDPVRRRAALSRFYASKEMHHDDRSFVMCLGADVPAIDLACWLHEDWTCLSKLARDIETRLHQRNGD